MASQFVVERDSEISAPPLGLGHVLRGREERSSDQTEVPPTFPGKGGLGAFPASPALSFAILQKWAAGRRAAFLRPQAAFLSQGAMIYCSSILSQPQALGMDFTFSIWSAFGVAAPCQEHSPKTD